MSEKKLKEIEENIIDEIKWREDSNIHDEDDDEHSTIHARHSIAVILGG